MTHIFVEEGQATSRSSRIEAISKALSSALAHTQFSGDHRSKISLIIEGCSFKNGKYHASVELIIFDDDAGKEEEEDLLRQLINDNNQEEEDVQKPMMDQYRAAVLNAQVLSRDYNHLQMIIMDVISQSGYPYSVDELTVIARQSIHVAIGLELGYGLQTTPVFRQAHTDLHDPTLGPGTAGHGDKAA